MVENGMIDLEAIKSQRFALKPMPGRIAVQVEEPEKVTKSGIILVGTSHAEKPVMGVVVAVCDEYEQDGEEFEPLFQKGDVVLFGKFTGSKVTLDRKSYIILRENDVLAKLLPDDSADAVEGRKVKINAAGE